MKNIKLSILCLVTIFLSATIFIACSSDQNLDGTTESNSEQITNPVSKSNAANSAGVTWTTPKNYGIYHNEILGIYLDKFSLSSEPTFTEVYNEILAEFELRYPNTLSQEERLFFEERIYTTFNSQNNNFNEDNYHSITESAIQTYYSPKLQTFFLPLLANPESPADVLNKLREFRRDNLLTTDEVLELDKFKNVLGQSALFWDDYSIKNPSAYNSLAQRGPCDPYYQIAFADAVGCMFGPLGSIGYSTMIYAMTKKKGGCI
ncbi:hypothetical protein J2X31_002063 [Flavobacterium arsenatis]|uniref:Lipoprotein n=1 Tax=Flavobacterium arsenatis TaxID=1484332 RepID=A0ABU1TR70_9FLAO|nr:hypothetical protein [Flavobacterium arsenatis]MDR6968048.1 hypothetical protein [Flavobacterium arsenatis]